MEQHDGQRRWVAADDDKRVSLAGRHDSLFACHWPAFKDAAILALDRLPARF
jgi:hypothetical protein